MARATETVTAVRYATAGAFAMIAHQVGGKATRDAIFLSTYDVTSLANMLILAAVVSIVAALLTSRLFATRGPIAILPVAFTASAVLLLAEWALWQVAPRPTAVVFYLHLAAFGGILISGFWSVVNERLDPHTARKQMGRIAGGGTFGGLVGGVTTFAIGSVLPVSVMLPALAAAHLFCAWAVRFLKPVGTGPADDAGAGPVDDDPTRRGLQLVTRRPYLRNLALMVLVVAITTALVDYVFKVHATRTLTQDDHLIRFFAGFYTLVSLLTFVVQTGATRRVLERHGPARTMATLPAVVAAGAVAVPLAPLVIPGAAVGLIAAAVLAAVASTLASSLFRSGYELLFNPIAPDEKRATKQIIDVGSDRLGDAAGGGTIHLLLALAPAAITHVLLALAAALAAAGVVIASTLQRGWKRQLEDRMREGAGNVLDTPLDTVMHSMASIQIDIRKTLEKTTGASRVGGPAGPGAGAAAGGAREAPTSFREPLIDDLLALRSGDPTRIIRTLRERAPLAPELVPQAITLLASDVVARDATAALQRVAPRHVGQLTDALLNADAEFTIRRRIPRILSVDESPRAVYGLVRGLSDQRFEVGCRCGRALARMRSRDPELRLPEETIWKAVRRETGVASGVWRSQRLLDEIDDAEPSPFADQSISDANLRLEHVFTLLSLILPTSSVREAYTALHTDDQGLRGTALEYLEVVLPSDVKRGLWPRLEVIPKHRPASREDAKRSQETMMLDLEEIRRQIRRDGD